MARVTVEDCLENVPNRFALVHVSAKRVRQLEKGAKRLVGSKNKNVVESLREIAEKHVRITQIDISGPDLKKEAE